VNNTQRRNKMNRRFSMQVICLGISVLFLAATSAMAMDEKAEEETGGGATAKAADMVDICKAQAAKRSLTGAEADDYLKKCAAPIGEAERSASPDERLEGQL
jgi:hypothetical protein